MAWPVVGIRRNGSRPEWFIVQRGRVPAPDVMPLKTWSGDLSAPRDRDPGARFGPRACARCASALRGATPVTDCACVQSIRKCLG